MSPLLGGRTPQGYLITASRASESFFAKIGHLARSDVAPVLGTAVSHTSGLDVSLVDLLATHRQAILAASSEQDTAMHLPVGHDIWVTPLKSDGGHAALIALDPSVPSDRGIDQETFRLIAGIAVFGLIDALYA